MNSAAFIEANPRRSRNLPSLMVILPRAHLVGYNGRMAKTTSQAARLEAEHKHAPYPSPAARVVETRYRLQPGDLPAAGLQATVKQVTRQGVEQVTPVLHLDGAPRPLLLDDENVRRMSALAGSPLHEDWLGVALTLVAASEEGEQVIRIYGAGASPAPARPLRAPRGQWRAALLLLLLLGLAFGAVYLVENWGQNWPIPGL